MLEVRLTPQARADLDDIWNFTVQRWDMEQAEAYLLSLDRTMKMLAESPRIGRKIDEVRQGYHLFPTGSHMLVYRLSSDAIEFVRVLHKPMDLKWHV